MNGTILYSTASIAAESAGERIARGTQSAAAQGLLTALERDFRASVRSKSHSRTLVAAAAGNLDGLALGIDVEWLGQDRPFSAIAGLFVDIGPKQIGRDDFYPVWTFGEAYFKAFQRNPPEVDLRRLLAQKTHDGVIMLADGTQVLQRTVDALFHLSLVWRAPDNTPCDLRYVSNA